MMLSKEKKKKKIGRLGSMDIQTTMDLQTIMDLFDLQDNMDLQASNFSTFAFSSKPPQEVSRQAN
jgi:hypothetical protein